MNAKQVSVLVATLFVSMVGVSTEQALGQSSIYGSDEGADWGDELGFAATNILLSGAVATLIAALRDDVTIAKALPTAAAGGAVVYLGKRVAVARFTGAGFLGRQVASMGASVGRNAGNGRGPLDELVFPVGIGRLYWDRTTTRVALRPDLSTIGLTVSAALESGLTLDWSRSLSAGAPVFLLSGATLGENVAGRAVGNVILADPLALSPLDDVLAHERVHVLQLDQHFTLWGDALEEWAMGLLGSRSARVAGHVDLVVPTMLVGVGVSALWSSGRDPLESEAQFLHGR